MRVRVLCVIVCVCVSGKSSETMRTYTQSHTHKRMQPKHDRKLPGGNFMSIVERHLKVKQTLPRPKGIFRCLSVCVRVRVLPTVSVYIGECAPAMCMCVSAAVSLC